MFVPHVTFCVLKVCITSQYLYLLQLLFLKLTPSEWTFVLKTETGFNSDVESDCTRNCLADLVMLRTSCNLTHL